MSYFVGYMLEGDTAAWHQETAKNISEHFGTWKVHEKVAPHLTIFYPFDTENIEPVVTLLEAWTAERKMPGIMHMREFGRFDDNVVFAKIEAPESVNVFVHELQSALMKVAATPRRGWRDWNPHATLAHRVPKETIKEMWEYLQTLPKPNFTLSFDNVTLFEYEGERRWSVRNVFNVTKD